MTKSKTEYAIELITQIRNMPKEQLTRMIQNEAGEELAQYFLNYAGRLIANDPEHVVQNASSLMLMGYLIRASEDTVASLSAMQKQAQA
jgi:hypothetical protein